MNNYFESIVKDISEIIKFDSSQQPAVGNMPFGEGVQKSLDYFLSLANSFGFQTKDYDGYVGEVVWGEGEPFAILAHLDVVPAGNGWIHPPFGGVIDYENKKIWGRGTMDDKGPAIIALYALKALKDRGFTPNRTIKLIVGCNEESGWACIDYYNKVAKMPDEGISPDADFPVIYAEKGIMQIKIETQNTSRATSILGGGAANMVCDLCTAVAPIDEQLLATYGLTNQDGVILSKGKSAHGSTPHLGINAISPILKYLGLFELENTLFTEKCGLKDLEDETGKLTFSPNVIQADESTITIICDCRYPATISREVVIDILEKSGLNYTTLHEQPALYNDKQCFLISTLLSVYNEVTGCCAQPIAIGGGTYARALKCGAAFGPEEQGEESTIHQPNEYITFEKIEKCFKIYTLAIERLTK